MSPPEAAPRSKPPRRRFWRGVLLAAGAGLVVLWLVHPLLLRKAIRLALTEAAGSAGLRVEVENISANLARPLVFQNLRLRARDPALSRTEAEVERIDVSLNWPWRAFFGDRRFFRSVTVLNLRGVFDFRETPGAPAAATGAPASSTGRPSSRAIVPRSLLPQFVGLQGTSLAFLAGRQSYYITDVAADFSEEKLGRFHASGAEVHIGDVHENFGTLEGMTAWNEGTVYLAKLPLRDGLEIQNFECHLARPQGLALGVKAEIFGGFLRGDISYDAAGMDATLWTTNVDVAQFAALLGFRDKAEGIVREARFKFRGAPERLLDGEASLRLEAEGFRWNKRGWESLEIGASLINRRLAVNDFALKQRDNSLTGNGELLLAENLKSMGRAPFTINASASIKDLGALAGLFGPPFDAMRGRMTLSSSISGQDGKLGGFLSMEGSDMGFRNRPIDSGRVEVKFVNREAQIEQCEFWSESDYLRGTGLVELGSPHNYSGEIQGRAGNISAYLDLLKISGFPVVYGGSAQVRWQGDGTASAHSGAFNVSLENFVSGRTPSGLTGRFAGTYSPQNVYFSGFELEQGRLRFSSRATLAGSGVKFQDGVLQSGGRELGEAEVFMPVDPFLLAAGRPFQDALHADKPVYANINTRGALGVRDLLKLAGNDAPVSGTVQMNLKATGLFSALQVDGKLAGRALAVKLDDVTTPFAKVDATVRSENGRAQVSGTVATANSPALSVKAEIPIGSAGKPDDSINGRIDLAKFNLSLLKPFLPKFRRISGSATGGVSLAGTVARPRYDGQVAVAGGGLQFTKQSPALDGINGLFKFEGEKITLEKLAGEVAAGPFELSGFAGFGAAPALDLTLTGKKILLAQDAGLRLRADVDLQARNGEVKGSVRLVDGRLNRRLEVTPVLAPSPVEQVWPGGGRLAGLAPASFGDWKLDVAIRNETPFLVVGNVAGGEIIPDVRLTGTLGNPLLLGRVTIKDVRAFLPFTTMTIQEGQLDFTEALPWTPILNVKGTARALEYEVQAYAFGPLSERRLVLRSEPPLPQESLILLLTTGIVPDTLTRQGDAKRLNRETPFSRLQAAVPSHQVAQPGLRGRIDLWRGLSMTGDGPGFSNPGATYTLRLR